MVWIGLGLVGQALFSARFIVQWIASERRRASHVPVAFWYLSIAGGITLLGYAVYRADPVFILGQSTGVFIYARNLFLIRHAQSQPVSAEG
ncbi:lipid-A-disaccharide synthase N-terminal domain-containing protein [Salinisphaera sp.]|uniref:lipid-A-disaccharide synthase N-terminal domain-containing protein n=1 Tax=Salinisphaera sp. TaxID=1914330 RepID=UPI000C5F013B|nr:lipid A biosynthesis protein [Salinisphaera sp.]